MFMARAAAVTEFVIIRDVSIVFGPSIREEVKGKIQQLTSDMSEVVLRLSLFIGPFLN